MERGSAARVQPRLPRAVNRAVARKGGAQMLNDDSVVDEDYVGDH
jgi:hypothetical protein